MEATIGIMEAPIRIEGKVMAAATGVDVRVAWCPTIKKVKAEGLSALTNCLIWD